HHRLVAERAEALRGVDAAVVELDPLADPVRAGAEDDDRAAAFGRTLVGLAPGRVEVIRGGLDLAGAGVHPAKRGPYPPRASLRPRGLLARPGGRGDVGVGEAEPLEPQPVVGDDVLQAQGPEPEPLELGPEPGMDPLRHLV